MWGEQLLLFISSLCETRSNTRSALNMYKNNKFAKSKKQQKIKTNTYDTNTTKCIFLAINYYLTNIIVKCKLSYKTIVCM